MSTLVTTTGCGADDELRGVRRFAREHIALELLPFFSFAARLRSDIFMMEDHQP